MAAMPFPCKDHLLCCVNIPTVLLMFFNNFASCTIPYFNLFLCFIVGCPALALNSVLLNNLYQYTKVFQCDMSTVIY